MVFDRLNFKTKYERFIVPGGHVKLRVRVPYANKKNTDELDVR